MDTGRGRPLRTALTLVKAAIGCLLALVVAGGLGTSTAPTAGPSAAASSAYDRMVARAVADQRCSPDRPVADASAASALIRTDAGRLRVVSFEAGWDVYNGRRPGQLVAVCLDDPGPDGPVTN